MFMNMVITSTVFQDIEGGKLYHLQEKMFRYKTIFPLN